MAYLGTSPNTGENRKLDDISGSFNGSTTTFDLQVDSSDIYPGTATALLISVGGVVQEPKTAYSLHSNGKQITFATAPATGEDFFGVALGQAIDIGTPADDAVTTAKINNNAVTAIKLADPLGFANVSGNVSIGRSLAVGFTDGRIPRANLDVKGNTYISGATTIAGALTLGTDLAVAQGGTGASSLTDGGVLLGSGTNAITAMGVLSDSQMIVGDGSTDPVAESGATLRTSIGVGTGNTPQFYGANVAGNVSVTRSLAVGYTDGRVPQANLEVTGNVVLSGSSYPNGGGLWSGRNVIINGANRVAQRSASTTGLTAAGYHTVDRWYTTLESTGTWTQSQATDVPTGQGFRNSIKMDCTTADASLAVADRLMLSYRIEAYDVQRFKKGTANAEKYAISFWVKGTKTGTHILEIYDHDNNRHICQAYTVSSTNTWEQKKLTFDADTTGEIANDNGKGMELQFYMAAGTNFTSGTLATSWAAAVSANRAVGQVNGADSTSNDFLITGLQMEVGTAATPFEFESYAESLQKCQRYVLGYSSVTGGGGAYHYYAGGLINTTTTLRAMFQFPVQMRTLPSLTTAAVAQFLTGYKGSGTTAVSAISINAHSNNMAGVIDITIGSAAMTAGEFGWILSNNNNTSFIIWDAEI